MKIILCINQQQDLTQLTQLLDNWSRQNAAPLQIDYFLQPEECEKYFCVHEPDLVIADIYLQNSLGLDLVKKLRQHQKKHFSLIFVSDKNSYAAETYELEADGYLLKPLDDKIFFKLLDKCNAACRSL